MLASLAALPETQAAAALAAGEAIIGIGASSGMFVLDAALASAASVNLMLLWGRGLTCFAVTPERAMRLGLLIAGEHPTFLRSVEAAGCTGTGISAEDRAMTLRAAGDPGAGPASLRSPGHVIPAMVAEGAESTAAAALSLLRRLTGHEVPAWTDILDDAGDLAPRAHCRALAARLGLACVEIG